MNPTINKILIRDIVTGKDLQELKNGDTLYLDKLPAKFNIRADVSNAKSVKFVLNDKEDIENIAPFCSFGDNTPLVLPDGKYNLEVTSCELPKGGGVKFTKLITFNALQVSPVGQINNIWLKDIDNATNVLQIVDGTVINSLPKNATIEVETTNVQKLRFQLGAIDHTEGIKPFQLKGDNVPVQLDNGNYKLTLTSDQSISTVVNFVVNASVPPIPPTQGVKMGIVTGTSAGVNKYKPVFDDLNIKGIRCWFGVDWNKQPTSKDFQEFKAFKDAGYEIVLCFATPKVPTASQAKTWFTNALAASNGIIDYWEINNEPNLPKYWEGTLGQYISNLLIPAYGVLHPANQKVIGGTISEKVESVKSLIDLGLLKYCDIVGFHPYGANTTEQVTRVKQVHDMIGQTPMYITEWNIHGATFSTWAKSLQPILDGVRPYVSAVYYYRSIAQGLYAGKAGVINSDFTKNEPFYSAVKALK